MKLLVKHIFLSTLYFITINCMAIDNQPNNAFYFPQPTGHYSVGLRTYHWTDSTRTNKISYDAQNPYRELMALIWYPAQTQTCPISPYHQTFWDFDTKCNHKITMLPPKTRQHFFAHYAIDAPLATNNQPFPMLIFSHGFGNVAELYTAYCTELASHGYIVVSINHPYDCAIASFPDGRTIPMPTNLETMTDDVFDTYLDENIITWITDTQFVVHKIEQENQNRNSIFYHACDLKRIGALGHSFGGATAVRCCQIDDRFMAACNLDGDLYGPEPCNPYTKPTILIQGLAAKRPQKSSHHHKQFQKKFGPHCLPGDHVSDESINPFTYVVNLPHVPHAAFTDRPLLRQAVSHPFISYTKRNDGFAVTKNINTIIRTFFDKHLKGIPCNELEWCKTNYAAALQRGR